MAYEKVFEACDDALRGKDYLIEAYKAENDKLRAKVDEMRALLAELQGGKEK